MPVFPLCLSSRRKTLPSNLKLNFLDARRCVVPRVCMNCVVVNTSQHHWHPENFLNYIWAPLKVETGCLRLCARINLSSLQLAAGGQECRVHGARPPAVKAGSDTAKAAADAKWTITAWPYLTWIEGRRNNSLTHPKDRNCWFFTCFTRTLLRVVKGCFVKQCDLWRLWRTVPECVVNRRIANWLFFIPKYSTADRSKKVISRLKSSIISTFIHC